MRKLLLIPLVALGLLLGTTLPVSATPELTVFDRYLDSQRCRFDMQYGNFPGPYAAARWFERTQSGDEHWICRILSVTMYYHRANGTYGSVYEHSPEDWPGDVALHWYGPEGVVDTNDIYKATFHLFEWFDGNGYPSLQCSNSAVLTATNTDGYQEGKWTQVTSSCS
jgi:hypothetical protein